MRSRRVQRDSEVFLCTMTAVRRVYVLPEKQFCHPTCVLARGAGLVPDVRLMDGKISFSATTEREPRRSRRMPALIVRRTLIQKADLGSQNQFSGLEPLNGGIYARIAGDSGREGICGGNSSFRHDCRSK